MGRHGVFIVGDVGRQLRRLVVDPDSLYLTVRDRKVGASDML